MSAQWKEMDEAFANVEAFRTYERQPNGSEGFGGDIGKAVSWRDPKPLLSDLSPVAAFDLRLLPSSIQLWVGDIAERMQCPPDFLGVSAMVALSAVVGRKIGVRPQAHTDWLEAANLWGCIVARPGAMKSPAMAQALAPLHRLEAKARAANEAARAEYELALEGFKLQKDEAQKKARTVLKGGGSIGDIIDITAPREPAAKRYVIMDATYESLGVVLAENPTECALSEMNLNRCSVLLTVRSTRQRVGSS